MHLMIKNKEHLFWIHLLWNSNQTKLTSIQNGWKLSFGVNKYNPLQRSIFSGIKWELLCIYTFERGSTVSTERKIIGSFGRGFFFQWIFWTWLRLVNMHFFSNCWCFVQKKLWVNSKNTNNCLFSALWMIYANETNPFNSLFITQQSITVDNDWIT